MSNKIILKNMMFYGFHGVHEFERELGQRFYVDVEISADLTKAGMSDKLTDTIDYSKTYEQIKFIMETQRFELLEAVGHKVATMVMDTTIAEKVVVKVRKPAVPLPGQLDYVEV